MKYTLSVVVPNYNNSKFLEQCVESIAAQSYDSLVEIIIVDDCSTDNSREIITALSQKHEIVKPLLLEKNCKVSAARNAGLYAAKGEYVTFVDADDCYYNKEKLENEMNIIKKFSELRKDVVSYSSIVQMSNDGKTCSEPKIPKEQYLQKNIYNRMLLDLRSSLVMRDYCIKTQILRDIGGYNANNCLFEDFELILKIAKKYEFYYTGETGTAYRNSINGLSKKPYKLLYDTKNSIIKEQLKEEFVLKRWLFIFVRSVVKCLKDLYRKIK